MINVYSSYAIDTGTGTATGLTISNVEVPSVVDGMIIFSWLVGPLGTGNTTIGFGSGGAQAATLIRTNAPWGTSYPTIAIHFLPRPEVGTFNLVADFNALNPATARGGLFAILTTNSRTLNYLRNSANTGLFGSGSSLGIAGSATEFQADVCVFNGRDTNGPPTGVGAGQSIIHNTTVNSGGGANSYGFCVSVKPVGGSSSGMSWTFGGVATSVHSALTLYDSTFNAPGLVTIRHAP